MMIRLENSLLSPTKKKKENISSSFQKGWNASAQKVLPLRTLHIVIVLQIRVRGLPGN